MRLLEGRGCGTGIPGGGIGCVMHESLGLVSEPCCLKHGVGTVDGAGRVSFPAAGSRIRRDWPCLCVDVEPY